MRNLFVTGLSSDIAMAYIQKLDIANTDLKIWGTYHSNGEMLEKVISELRYIEVHPIVCDLSDGGQIVEIVRRLTKEDHVIDAYLHCASAQIVYKRFRDFDWEDTKRQMDIKVGAFAKVCSVLAPAMAKHGKGRILALCSAYSIGMPPEHMADYVVVNHALIGLIRAIAKEYEGRKVCVNAISPGMIKTKFLDNLDDRIAQITVNKTALGRCVTMDEVLAGIDYLLSEEAACVNGINLNLSGGESV